MIFTRSNAEFSENISTEGAIADWQLFGLQRDPFPAYLEGSVDYIPSQWEQHLDLLQHLIRNSNTLLAVIGERGVGKTTLLNRLILETLNEDSQQGETIEPRLLTEHLAILESDTIRVCKTNADAGFDPDRLLDFIAEGFELPWQSSEILEEQFDSQVENLQQSPRTCLLILDDAHLLPSETVESLLYMVGQQSDAQMRFHVVLFGESPLKSCLLEVNEYQGTSDLTCVLDLESLSREETERYLQYRLSNAGLEGTLPLSQTDITRIYKVSRGIPSQINRVARQILVGATQERWQASSSLLASLREHQAKLLGGALLVGIMLFVGFQLFDNENDAFQSTIRQPQITLSGQPDHPVPAHASAVEVAENAAVSSSEAGVVDVLTASLQPQTGVAHQLLKGSTAPVDEETTDIPKQKNSKPVPIVTVSAKDEEIVIPEMMETTVLDDGPIEVVVNRPNVVPVKPAVKAKTPSVEKLKSGPAKSPTEKQGLTSKPEYFTLQVVGVREERKLVKMIKEYNLENKARYVHTRHQGKDWFVLWYGQYTSAQQARADVTKLPKPLQDLKPWVRRVTNAQQT